MIKTQGFDIILTKIKWAKRDPLLISNIKNHMSLLYLPQFLKYIFKTLENFFYTEMLNQQLLGATVRPRAWIPWLKPLLT